MKSMKHHAVVLGGMDSRTPSESMALERPYFNAIVKEFGVLAVVASWVEFAAVRDKFRLQCGVPPAKIELSPTATTDDHSALETWSKIDLVGRGAIPPVDGTVNFEIC